MQSSSTPRKSNLELLRIIAMILIVGSHIVGHCVFQIYDGSDPNYNFFERTNLINKILAGLFSSGGDMGNYIFFLLMGYFYDFNISMKKKIHKLLKLSIEVYFYAAVAVIVLLVPYLTNIYRFEEMGTKGIITNLAALCLPVTSEVWWFITTYVLIFIILSAFPVVDQLNKKQFTMGMIVFLFLNMIRLNSGSYNKIFMNMFVVLGGVYIRKFIDISKSGSKKVVMYFVLAVVLWLLSAGSMLFFYKYHLSDSEFVIRSISRIVNHLGGYIKMLFAFCMLLLFANIPVKTSRIINRISKSTFGIYLLHGSPFFVYFFFHHLQFLSNQYLTYFFPLVFLGSITLIFIVALLLDKIQRALNDRVFDFLIGKIQSF